MYAALGYGGITLTKVLNKVKDEVGRVRRAAERTEKAEQLIAQQPHQPPKRPNTASPASLWRASTTA